MVKVRSYGALMGALLTVTAVEAADAATPPPPKPATVVHRAPAVHPSNAGEAYAQSFYNYRSASRVTEEFVRHAPAGAPLAPLARNDGWQVAPNDAHIRFYRDYREVIVPGAPYPQPYYYQQPSSYYAPPPVYTPPGYAPSAYAPQDGLDIEQQGFNGGVGAMNGPGGGGGGGYGGTAYLYMNNGGGSDVPPNGGGVNLPGGYGPTYQGVWQGPVVPTRGGLSSGGSH